MNLILQFKYPSGAEYFCQVSVPENFPVLMSSNNSPMMIVRTQDGSEVWRGRA